MSLIQLKKLVDVRIDGLRATEATHDAVLGASNLVQQKFQPTAYSASNLDFVIQTPGLGVYMSRRVNISVQIPLTFTITSGAQAASIVGTGISFGEWLGVEAFPFNSLISNGTVQISTSNFTTQVQQSLPVIKRMLRHPKIRARLGEVPTGLSSGSQILYKTGTSMDQPTIDTGAVYGTAAGNASWNWTWANNAQPVFPAAGQSVVCNGTLTIYEPLLLQPFLWDDEQPAFINTNLITVRLNLTAPDAPLARILRFVTPGGAGANKQYTVSGLAFGGSIGTAMQSARLVSSFYTPPVTAKPPAKALYPTTFFNPLATAYTNTIVSHTQVDRGSLISNVITLNTAPDMIAVYFIPNLPATNDGDPNAPGGTAGAMLEDTCLAITGVSVQWNNNPSLLETFDTQELYHRTVQNGMYVNWAEFSGTAYDSLQACAGNQTYQAGTFGVDSTSRRATVGSPLLLALNKDIPVEPGVASGVAGVYTLRVGVSVYNQLPFDAVNGGTLYVCPIYSQYLVLNAGATSDVINTVATESQVVETPVSGDLQDKAAATGAGKVGMIGGSMMAHSRSLGGTSRLLDMVHRGGGPGAAAAYIGSKRPHLEGM